MRKSNDVDSSIMNEQLKCNMLAEYFSDALIEFLIHCYKYLSLIDVSGVTVFKASHELIKSGYIFDILSLTAVHFFRSCITSFVSFAPNHRVMLVPIRFWRFRCIEL